MNIWFTSDTHFGHAKIIEHSRRPFANADEMDAVLIANWNALVSKRDEVWHLGDFNFRSVHPTEWYISQLNGHIHIVWGNHDDRFAKRHASLFESAQDSKYLRLNNHRLTLYHYSQRTWRNSRHGAWHLYGHSHGDLPPLGKSMDVGTDAHDYKPVSWDAVEAYMLDKDNVEHHPVLSKS